MHKTHISFIGAGNMARSLIGGLIASGFPANHLWATNTDASLLAELHSTFSIHTTQDNAHAAAHSDVVVLCVKPQIMASVCQDLQTVLQTREVLVLSIAAGITTQQINHWLAQDLPIVRTMPNTPALVQAGMTGLFATAKVNATQRSWAEEIMRAVGMILWVDDESLLDAVTAISGSGPAYFLLFMEALAAAGVKLGLTAANSHLLVMQTALGAAKLALESHEEWSALRNRITSPGGTTEQALQVFTPELLLLCEKAAQAAYERSIALRQL